MSRKRLAISAVVVAAVGAGAGVLIGQQRSADEPGAGGTSEIAREQEQVPPAAPAFTPAQLAEPPTGWWATNGGDLSNRRYSPLDLIDTENVAGLRGVWRVELDSPADERHSAHAQPLYYGGVLYVSTGAGDVFAVDVEDGTTRWKHEGGGCCENAGVALGDGRVYVGSSDGALVALDQASGEEVWRTEPEAGTRITSAPLYYGGRVIAGVAGEGIRGRVVAHDAATGREAWRFHTVAGPDETGFETWPQGTDAWRRGGAAVSQTPAVDPQAGLVYFSTGTAWPPHDGAGRDGDNLFTSSIVAVDAASGEYRWHFQQVHHDLWGYDADSPVVLFDVEVDGFGRRLLAQTGETGWTYVIDRETGEVAAPAGDYQVPQEPSQRTSGSQPIPDYGPFVPHEPTSAGIEGATAGDVFDPFAGELVAIAPGARGGIGRQPASYNPGTRLLYLCGSRSVTGYRRGEVVEPPLATQPGYFGAWSPETGEVAWQHRWPEPCWSGTVTTGGGLVFVGRNDGHLEAYDAAEGERLWRFDTGAGANATVTTFGRNGAQYVAFLAGGSAAVGSERGNVLWLFALDGTLGPQAG